MQTIYFLKAYDIHYQLTTWWPLGDHWVTTGWPLGDHLVTTWSKILTSEPTVRSRSWARGGECFLCHTKLVQEGKSWKAWNLLSLPHSRSLKSKSKLSNLCWNSWARLHCYPHSQSLTHIKPRSGCHRLSSNLDWSRTDLQLEVVYHATTLSGL